MKTAVQKFTASKSWTSPLSGVKDSKMNIDAVVEELDEISFILSKKLRFYMDHETREILVEVIDPKTDKVVRVLPPEELRRLHHKVEEAIGVIVNELV
jgi:flagellar protein FlaG